jgi:NADH-quinone oxidoreductase subunit I
MESYVKVVKVEDVSILDTPKGLWITFSNFLRTIFLRNRATIQYPEEERDYSNRFRGVHILTKHDDGSPKCTACYLCATICPADCIDIEADEHPNNRVEKVPTKFDIDMLRCVFCGYCVDACPEEAIIMSKEYDLATVTREESIFTIDMLLNRADQLKFDEGYRPHSKPLGDGGTRGKMEDAGILRKAKKK